MNGAPVDLSLARALRALAFSSAVAAVAYRRGSLTGSGMAGAIAVGGATWLAGGLRWSAILLGFFGSSSALSQLERHSAGGKAIAQMTERGARRDLVQALANGGPATLAAALFTVRQAAPAAAAFAGSLAAANSDTWATEIGGLSPSPPRHILTGRPVPPGTSGGITPAGLAGSAAGSALIGLLAGTLLQRRRSFRTALTITVAGMAGSLLDSVIGAGLQASYWCAACNKPTERRIHTCGSRTELVRGLAWCSNDVVNVVCTAAGGAVAALLADRDQGTY
ncbi:MAG TPA: DUF92 domain-containing protein [Chloroflexota bacterium]|nr:DUF92 domain-containing protein [Chloroflexota bacterium]